ncbi:MAG: ATP-binding protein [Candidatus Thiodiazotropha sp.]
MSDVYGQSHARRALEISAAGAHSLLTLYPIADNTNIVNKAQVINEL